MFGTCVHSWPAAGWDRPTGWNVHGKVNEVRSGDLQKAPNTCTSSGKERGFKQEVCVLEEGLGNRVGFTKC